MHILGSMANYRTFFLASCTLIKHSKFPRKFSNCTLWIDKNRTLKFIYSEKATKFCEISTLLLSYVVPVKSKVEISQNFVAFSEYMNFKVVFDTFKKFTTYSSNCPYIKISRNIKIFTVSINNVLLLLLTDSNKNH